VPAAVARAVRYEQADNLLVERTSQRGISRVTGLARVIVARRVKKAPMLSPPLPRPRPKKARVKSWQALEPDEMWTFVGHKARKVWLWLWLWLVVGRASRRLVAWRLGCRGEATLRRLWRGLPARYRRHCRYFTDEWKAYPNGLPRGPHRPCPEGEGQTSIAEALSCSLRQRCGVLVRASGSFSQDLAMHTARIKLVVDKHNQQIILMDYRRNKKLKNVHLRPQFHPEPLAHDPDNFFG